ncbi:MAG: signal peptidase I [Lachnospirales bacterium]
MERERAVDGLKSIVKIAIQLLVLVLIILFIQTFIFRVIVTDGDSMSPTIEHKDMLVISKLPYLFGEPEVGDIVVFPYKGNNKDKYIKRVVATEGDVLDIENGTIYINDEVLDDEYSHDITTMGDIDYPFTVPEDRYFCMGDNRNASRDSRFLDVGVMSESDFLGRVIFKFYPFSKAFEDLDASFNY